jgi:hypothetical protein
MTRNHGKPGKSDVTFCDVEIGSANPANMNLDQNLAGTGHWLPDIAEAKGCRLSRRWRR